MCKNCTVCRKIWGSHASTAVLGCLLTTKLDEPSCSDQCCDSERFSKPSLSSTNQNHQVHMKTKSKITNYIIHCIAAAVLVLTAQISLASSATWLLSPRNSAWENANNWTPGGPPNGP